MYDVIVIGAGPAGATAAKTLAENGCRVLLVEKCRLPRYKSCSGQLIQKTVDLVQRYFGQAVPSCALCAPAENRGMVFTDDRGRAFAFAQPGLNVWRSAFDGWLTEQAAKSGAEVRDSTAALSCQAEGEGVTVALHGRERYTERAAYLIDCEGVVGTVKRRLTGERPAYIATYQTFNEGRIDLDPHYFYAYLQPALSEYDAWFNVKANLLVLGVSARAPEKIPGFYARFLAYMQREHHLQIDRQLGVDRWLMPYIRPGCAIRHGVGRVLFAGETAGFLNPMGEGISAGLESGYLAAQAVAAHFARPDLALAAYREQTGPLHRYMQRQWQLVAAMAGTFGEMKG